MALKNKSWYFKYISITKKECAAGALNPSVIPILPVTSPIPYAPHSWASRKNQNNDHIKKPSLSLSILLFVTEYLFHVFIFEVFIITHLALGRIFWFLSVSLPSGLPGATTCLQLQAAPSWVAVTGIDQRSTPSPWIFPSILDVSAWHVQHLCVDLTCYLFHSVSPLSCLILSDPPGLLCFCQIHPEIWLPLPWSFP